MKPFLNYLLKKIALKLPYRPETLFIWRDASPYQFALGVKHGS